MGVFPFRVLGDFLVKSSAKLETAESDLIPQRIKSWILYKAIAKGKELNKYLR